MNLARQRFRNGYARPFIFRPRHIVLAILVLFSLISVGKTLTRQIRTIHYRRLIASLESLRRAPFAGRIAGFRPKRIINHGVGSEIIGIRFGLAGGQSFARRSTEPDVLQMRGLAGQVIEDQSVNEDENAHAIGLAYLALGNYGQSIRFFRQAADREPKDATLWNDLSVALLTGAGTGHPEYLIQGLAATDRSLQQSRRLPEALFNRALILDGMGLTELAASAYDQCMLSNPSVDLFREARGHKTPLQKVTTAESWDASKRVLLNLTAADRVMYVPGVVAHFRQETRTWAEVEVLGEWAKASAAGDSRNAGNLLDLAEQVGRALEQVNGEHLLADAVATIRSSTGTQRVALEGGYQRYLEARLLYRDLRYAATLPRMQEAATLFHRAKTPMALVAEYYVASCRYDLGQTDQSLKAIDALLATVPPKYLALRGQLLWERATASESRGRLDEALHAQLQARRTFGLLGERRNARTMDAAIASTEALLGRSSETWLMRIVGFSTASSDGDRAGLQTLLELAARIEAYEHHWESARALFSLASSPKLSLNPRLAASAFLWRGLANYQLGELHAAFADLAAARRTASKIPDDKPRIDTLEEIRFASSVLTRRCCDTRRALRLLSQVIAQSSHRGRTFLLPEAYIERADTERDLGHDQNAIEDLRMAMQLLSERGIATRVDLRNAFFNTTDAALHKYVDLLTWRNEWDRARAAIETARGSTRSSIRTEEQLATLPPDLTFLEYFSLADRTIIFCVRHDGVSATTVLVSDKELRRTTDDLKQAIESRGQRSEMDRMIVQLSAWLIEPVMPMLRQTRRLVIIPDRTIDSVPFAALRPRNRRPLIQDFEIAFAQSISLPKMDTNRKTADRGILIIGDPAFDRKANPDFARLPEAGREASLLASLYKTHAHLLTEQEASPSTVASELRTVSIAHFATHAVVDPDEPSRSYLLLAANDIGWGRLYLPEIARLDLSSLRLVVLVGCTTAAPVAGGPSVNGLAPAFLDAGAQNAIGALWSIDDDLALHFSITLHRLLLKGLTPGAALRTAQIGMANSPDGHLNDLRAWSGLRIYTAAP